MSEASPPKTRSRFTLDERKRHALQSNLGGGWLTLSADGRYDEAIAFEQERRDMVQEKQEVDIRECPDCRGSTLKSAPDGKGMMKCKHEKLLAAVG